MPFHLCNFMQQSNHQPCTHNVRDGTALCGMHTPIAARMPDRREHQCEHIVGGDHWCAREAEDGDRLCAIHIGRRERERADEVRMAEALAAQRAAARAEVAEWRAGMQARAAQAAADDGAWRARVRELMGDQAGDWGLPFAAAAPAAPAARAAPMARLAADRQNVHTGAVGKQTRDGEAKLLAVPTDGKPVGLRVLRTFANRAGGLTPTLRVMNDMDHWIHEQNCRAVGDRLYGRLLEGLWTLIEQQPEEQRAELKNRLWEEAWESVGMCLEGHVSRLVNVMVGFDEAFQPKMSTGEAVQNKIAALAASEMSDEDKLTQARAFMGELGMDAAAQAPWLEALA